MGIGPRYQTLVHQRVGNLAGKRPDLTEQEIARLGDTLRRIEKERLELPSVRLTIRLLILTGARLSF